MKPQIDFKEHRKMRIRLLDESFHKHEVCKLLLVILLSNKHKDWGIYTEYVLKDGSIPDVCCDTGNGLILYECQKAISPSWKEKIASRDENMSIQMLQKVDTIIVPIQELSDNLNNLAKELKEKYLV